MSKYAKIVTEPVPQNEPLNDRQAPNNGGGYSFVLDKWARLQRFLILGSEGGTYYVDEKKLTKQNFKVVQECLAEDGLRTVREIVDVSVAGRAPRQDAGIFALAVAAASEDDVTRSAAYAAVPEVCRTASVLFQFLADFKCFKKLSGRGFRSMIKKWYESKPVEGVAYQMVKYRQREGWTHADVLRLGHPAPSGDEVRDNLYGWAVDGVWKSPAVPMPKALSGYLAAAGCSDAKSVAKIVRDNDLPREAVPTNLLTSPEVWDALLPHMPLTGLVRNLGNMTKVGLLTQTSSAVDTVLAKLGDEDYIRKSRLHPMAILIALKTYASGAGFRGAGAWTPVQSVVGALDEAFYKAFGNVQPTGKRFMVGIDVSGSMSAQIANTNLTCTEAAAAMAMIWAATEPRCYVAGFNQGLQDLGFSKRMSLLDATRQAATRNYGGTDCALPMIWADANKEDFDVFVVLTDSETNAGRVHPQTALAQYRKNRVADAREVVIGMTATEFTIADPKDPLTMDVVGFDTTVPSVIAQFVNGKV